MPKYMIGFSQRKFQVHFFIDFFIAALSYFSLYIFRFNSINTLFPKIYSPDIKEYLFIFLLWSAIITILFKWKGLYSSGRETGIGEEVMGVVISISYAAILVAAFIFFVQYKFFSRIVFFGSFFLFCIFLSGWRIAVRLIARKLNEGKLPSLKILITKAAKIGGVLKKLILDKIDGAIRLFIYALILILPFSKAGIEICFAIILSLWLIKRLLLNSYRPKESILNRPLLLYIIAGALSALTSTDFEVSLHAFFSKFIEGVLLYFIIIETIKRSRHISVVIWLFLCATVAVSVDGIIQRFFTGTDVFRHMPLVREGITAAFNHKNDLGGYLIIPLSLTLLLMVKRLAIFTKKRRGLSNHLILATLVNLFFYFTIAILLSKSRGAWFSLLSGLLIFSILIYVRGRLLTFIFSIGVLLAIYFLFIGHSIDIAAFKMQHDTISRLEMWRDGLTAIKNKPFFGYGINTYMRTFIQRNPATAPTYTHNCFLQMGAEMGMLGLVCFLWVIIRLFSRCVQEIRNRVRPAGLRFLLAGLLCGLLAFLIHSFVDTNLYSLQLNTLFWYIVGLTVCIYMQLIENP